MAFYFSNKIDDTLPYYKIEVTGESSFLVFGNPYQRGDSIYIQVDSEWYERTKDKNGTSWLDVPSANYRVSLLDPKKDEKLKDQTVLEAVPVAEDETIVVVTEEPAPTPKGRRSKAESKE